MKLILILIMATLSFHSTITQAFELEDFNGKPVKLDNMIGNEKWTLIMFWAHNCGVCKAEFPALSEFNVKRKDIDVIGISIDGEENKHLASAFMRSSNPSFESYITSLSLVSFNYEALTQENFRGTPTFLLFTPEGELLGNNPGKLSLESLENFIAKNSK